RQGGAGHYATTVFTKEHSAQDWGQIDRRSIESEEALRFPSALDPVDVFPCALLQKNGDTVPRVADASAKFLQFCLEHFVVGALHHFGYTCLQRGQSASDRVWNKIDIADPKLAAFTKIRFRLDCGKKFLDVLDQFGRESHADGIARHRE